MSNLYPSSLNNYPTGVNSPLLSDMGHVSEHNALEAKVGVDGSAVVTSLDYLLKNTSSLNPGHKHTAANGASDKTFPSGTIVGTTDTQTLSNKTLTTPVKVVYSGTTGPTIKASANTFTFRNDGDSNGAVIAGFSALLQDTTLTPTAGTNTITIPAGTDTLVGKATTDTLTNKRITRRVVNTTQAAEPAINTDVTDVSHITGLAQAITSMTTNLSGTPVAGDRLIINITDNGTARAIAWGLSFESSGNVTLPTTTVLGVRLDVGFIWNEATTKWRCVAVA